MADSIESLRGKIQELQQELALKENQLQSYRLQIKKVNQNLESMIAQVSQELRLAQEIQKRLSPTELPQIQGFEISTKYVPGTATGGDYFDIFEHDDRLRFGLILSSSSGYAMSALFLSILMKLSTRIESRKGLEPHAALLQVFAEMKPSLGPSDRASLFYGWMDRRDYRLHYSHTGHLKIFCQRKGQDSLEILPSQGERLEKDFNTSLQTVSLPLDSKDRLILCSEGVVQGLSQESLIEIIRSQAKMGVHDMRNEILYQLELTLEKSKGVKESTRDLTVIVVEVKDRVIKLAKS